MCCFSIILLLEGIMTFKVKESMYFVKESINFNKNETELKMENPTHSLRETNLVEGSQIRSKTMMSWSS